MEFENTYIHLSICLLSMYHLSICLLSMYHLSIIYVSSICLSIIYVSSICLLSMYHLSIIYVSSIYLSIIYVSSIYLSIIYLPTYLLTYLSREESKELRLLRMNLCLHRLRSTHQNDSGWNHMVTAKHSLRITSVPHSNHTWKTGICFIFYI